MSKIGFAAILFLIMGKGYSQENHFILIEVENNQPFYAIMDGKTYPSSPSGHLILSRLKDSVYLVTIGLPKGLPPEQQFSIRIDKEDLRFQLKSLGERGWGLFDPQSAEVKASLRKSTSEKGKGPEVVKKDDAFSRLMAGVVNDTAVMYAGFVAEQPIAGSTPGERKEMDPGTPPPPFINKSGATDGAAPPKENPAKGVLEVHKDEEVRPPLSGGAAGKDSAIKDSTLVIVSNLVKDSSSGAPPANTMVPKILKDTALKTGKTIVPKTEKGLTPVKEKIPFVEKLSEKRTSKQVRMVFVDHGKKGVGDTILIRIPVDSLPVPAVPGAGTGPKGKASEGIGTAGPAGPVLTGDRNLPVTAKKPVVINSDCRNFASNGDVDKLRVSMMTAVSDQARIDLATKVFRSKCFTTGQVKALNELFVNDAGRFRFFAAAYPFVTDSDQFKSLVNLLADPILIHRFKKMTGQQQ